MRAVWCIFLLLVVSTVDAAEPLRPYIDYDITETRRTASDHRWCSTHFFLLANDQVGYGYGEDVSGAITPSVKSLKFSSEYHEATKGEQSKLINALLAAGIFDLVDEPQPAKTDYFSRLDVRINSREKTVHFYSPPNSPARKAIHEIILGFAHRIKLDRPKDLAKATTITEGDNEPARPVKLSELIAHPENYHGKRVSTIGFYHGEFEGSNFAVDQAASEKSDYKKSVWKGGASTLADPANFKDENNSWQRIEGIFLRGPTGHMGLWPGEIERLTRVEPVQKPE